MLTFLLAGRALGVQYGLAAAALAWSLGSLAGVASGTPGGVGTTESAALVPLLALGIPASQALAAILLARLIQYASAILLGGACFAAAPVPVRTAARAGGGEPCALVDPDTRTRASPSSK